MAGGIEVSVLGRYAAYPSMHQALRARFMHRRARAAKRRSLGG